MAFALTRSCAVILVVISYISCSRGVLQCYKCTLQPESVYRNRTERLCANFDYSKKYEEPCPYSTLCMKRVSEVQINGATLQVVLRDCALQKYKYQAYDNGKWQQQIRIEQPYAEGCDFVDDKGARSVNLKYCYCRSNLCNDSNNLEESSYHVDAICVIFVYNALKLFYSLR